LKPSENILVNDKSLENDWLRVKYPVIDLNDEYILDEIRFMLIKLVIEVDMLANLCKD
jgi:hypothetical protein